jgi:hypothetical protein
MFESDFLGVEDLLALAAGLGRLERSVDDRARVDRIRALEVLKSAASAAQARDAADLDASQRALQSAAGVPADELGRGVAAQVALARRDSPHRGGRHLGLAKALVHEMPCTLAALEAGRISEWRATILVRETAVLTREDRAAVDRAVAGDVATLERLGDRALASRARQVAYRLDAQSVVARARRAEAERRVTIRPAPDTMAYLTALLPVRDAVAVHAALGRAAEQARCAGDERGRGQLMADSLVSSLRTAAAAEATGSTPGSDDLAVRLVMTDRTLLDGDDEPARLEGYGPVPAAWARELVASTLDTDARVFVTRLLVDPTGALVAAESRARIAPRGLAAQIRSRDGGTCRTSWCDAPIRHVDHVVPHAAGGRTSAEALQGLCEACNHIKQSLGWRARTGPAPPGHDGLHTVLTTTPTGHTYCSTAPPLPGTGELVTGGVRNRSPIESLLDARLALAA